MSTPGDTRWINLLRENLGFERPELWVEHARAHGFERVRARVRPSCPDCGNSANEIRGQYVYYSTMIRLRCCKACQLRYSDALLPEELIAAHFERTYKDEEYFLRGRRDVFAFAASLVDRAAPIGGSVLDIGGAKGHLLAQVARRRPDLHLVLNDVSRTACESAQSRLGLETVVGTIPSLAVLRQRFDVVLLVDVLYYEPEIASAWAALDGLTAPQGTIILRIPNRLLRIEAAAKIRRAAGLRYAPPMATAVRGMNPEQIYVFSRAYLRRRLGSVGFHEVKFLPSPLLRSDSLTDRLAPGLYELARAVNALTGRGAVLTPSMIVTAGRRGGSN